MRREEQHNPRRLEQLRVDEVDALILREEVVGAGGLGSGVDLEAVEQRHEGRRVCVGSDVGGFGGEFDAEVMELAHGGAGPGGVDGGVRGAGLHGGFVPVGGSLDRPQANGPAVDAHGDRAGFLSFSASMLLLVVRYVQGAHLGLVSHEGALHGGGALGCAEWYAAVL